MTDNLRHSGVFLPIFSLPGEYGIGTIGKNAKTFIDFLHDSGFTYWVVLPLGPTSFGDSPFQAFSSRALNHFLIDFDDLLDRGLLKKKDFKGYEFGSDPRRIDYKAIYQTKIPLLKIAYRRFKRGIGGYERGYATFLKKNRFLDYACFMVLKELNNGKPWNQFRGCYKEYSQENFSKFKEQHQEEVEFYIWTQYIFLKQWTSLVDYAHLKGIKIIGDMPMHVSYDSIDVYKHHRNFILDENNEMEYSAGYPPDVFYSKGQAWGTPLYDFDYLKRSDYRVFKDRLNFAYSLFDVVILDHFRGYLENYLVKSKNKNGLFGQWEKTLGQTIVDHFVSNKARVIAEDVDFHSQELNQVLLSLKIKDERVIEFGYPREIGNNNRPKNYTYQNVSFSSTHDCLPLKAYLESLSVQDRKEAVLQINKDCRHFGVDMVKEDDIKSQVNALLQLNLASLSCIAIQSMSDLLYHGAEGRINTPSTVGNNWVYRITEEDLKKTECKSLYLLNRRYGRC